MFTYTEFKGFPYVNCNLKLFLVIPISSRGHQNHFPCVGTMKVWITELISSCVYCPESNQYRSIWKFWTLNWNDELWNFEQVLIFFTNPARSVPSPPIYRNSLPKNCSALWNSSSLAFWKEFKIKFHTLSQHEFAENITLSPIFLNIQKKLPLKLHFRTKWFRFV